MLMKCCWKSVDNSNIFRMWWNNTRTLATLQAPLENHPVMLFLHTTDQRCVKQLRTTLQAPVIKSFHWTRHFIGYWNNCRNPVPHCDMIINKPVIIHSAMTNCVIMYHYLIRVLGIWQFTTSIFINLHGYQLYLPSLRPVDNSCFVG